MTRVENIVKALEAFQIVKLEFALTAQDDIRLPEYKGSALRGGFGQALKKVLCKEERKNCDACLRIKDCLFPYLFNSRLPEDSAVLKNTKNIPAPFVIEPPLENKEAFKKGEEILFNLILIGKAGSYLPYFIFAFEELGRMGLGKGFGTFSLKSVNQTGNDGKKRTIFRNGKFADSPLSVSSFQDLAKGKETYYSMNKLSLRLVTPLRIEVEGKVCRRFQFRPFFTNLSRRISNLLAFHHGATPELDFKGLAARSEKVEILEDATFFKDWERYSSRQDQRVKMGGLMGDVSISGDLEELIPFLILGEAAHAGKYATFGMGKYEIL